METGGPEVTEVVGVSQDEKTHAMLSWILMIVIGFISPLIFFLIDKDKPFVYRHAAQGLAFCITLIPLYIVMFILGFILALAGPLALLMIPLYLALLVFVIYVVVMGAVNANKGLTFDPPISSQVCKMIFKL
ncbi:MAG TPA: DUF4870 domain-containing protein [Fimbriimonadaceae bacterium]|nr:DUF4870 domain-containing protein [Fimbriimonadaceae bacterium]